MKKVFLTSMFFVKVIVFSGCTAKTTVNLLERYRFAEYAIDPKRDPLTMKMNDHAYFSREGSFGGRGAGGGGCGCN